MSILKRKRQSERLAERKNNGRKTMEKAKNSFALWQLPVAFLFLFNPNVAVIDLLPDAIGYLLICAALFRLSDMNGALSEAHKLFGRMVAVDIAKLLSVFMIFGLSYGGEQSTLLLLISFAFGVIELFLLIPAYNNLFTGFLQLGYKYDNNSIMGSPNGGHAKKNYTERAAGITSFYIIFKVIMCVLPEFSVLATQSADTAVSTVNLYDFISLLRGASILLCTVVGLVWLAKMICYFARIRRDRSLIAEISNDYTKNVLPNKSIFLRRRLKNAFFLIGGFALLSLDVKLDNINAIPDVFSALLLLIALICIRREIVSYKKYLGVTFIYAIISIMAGYVENGFFEKYYYSAVIRSEEAASHYMTMLSLSVLEAAFFLLSVFCVIRLLKTVIREYTGFSVEGAETLAKQRVALLHKELSRKLYFLAGGAIISVAADLFYDFSAHAYGFAGLARCAGSLVFFLTAVYALVGIYEEVEAKYMLD